MGLLANLKISKKIGAAFIALVAGAGAMGGIVYVNMAQIDHVRMQSAARMSNLAAVISARGALSRQENSLRGFMLTRDDYYTDRIKKHFGAFTDDVQLVRQASVYFPELGPKMDKLEADIAQWHKQFVDKIVLLSRDPATLPNALKMMGGGAGDAFLDPAEQILDELKEETYAQMALNADLQIAAFENARFTLISGIGLLLAAAVALGVLLSRGIADPVSRLKNVMVQLAAGDKSVQVPSLTRKDEVGEMARVVEAFKLAAVEQARLEGTASSLRQTSEAEREKQAQFETARASEMRQFVSAVDGGFEALASGNLTVRLEDSVGPEFEPVRQRFNDSVARLEDALSAVVTTIGAIRTGLSEITVASGDLSQRTEQQAASLEQTVAALSEVTAGVNETAAGAAQARGAAEAAMESAEKGGAIVERAIEAMSGIERSSQQINQIIGVIDEIAFQTNLLALNAGVEAARAGEAGRGFAVVAQEVRGLAQRSAEAAKEIKGLISASKEQVEAGVELVSASGASLKEIVAQVAKVSGVVGGIAAGTKEQAVSLKEVSVAADQMDKVTQQNAAMVEEATAAAQALSHETDALAQLVQRFQTHAASQMVPANTRRHVPAAQPNRGVVQIKHSGRTGAQPASQADAYSEGWEEF